MNGTTISARRWTASARDGMATLLARARQLGAAAGTSRVARHGLAAAMVLVTACVAGWIIHREFHFRHEQTAARLEAVADRQAALVGDWVARHMNLAAYLRDSMPLADLYARWQDHGDAEAGRLLLSRAAGLRRINDSDSALLFDADANLLLREHPEAPSTSPELRTAIIESIARARPVNTGVYRSADAAMPVRMDVVIPLARTGVPPHGVLVFRIDARRSLFPLLASGSASPSTESVLWERLGERVQTVSDTRQLPDGARPLSEPIADSLLPIARALRDDPELGGRLVDGTDYRGEPVLAVVRPVDHTSWWMVAKVDRDEVNAPAWRSACATTIAALLLLVALGVGARLWWRRQALGFTARDQVAERERLRTLNLLETLAQSASDIIFAKDLDGRYVFCNRAAADMVGMTPERMVGRDNHELFGAAMADRLLQNDRLTLAGTGPRSFEETIATARGERTVRGTTGPMFDADGQLVGLYGVARDVTETLRAERALRDSEAHFRSVVSVLHEGVMVNDVEGRVLSCNPAAERIIGSTSVDWQGRTIVAPGWVPLRADGSPMPPEETPAGVVLQGAPAQHDVVMRAVSPAGEMVIFEVSAVPVISPDTRQPMAVVTSFSNVTKRKQLEEELERHRHQLERLVAERTGELSRANEALGRSRDEAESATHAKSAFLANMSHEIRTPMNAIIGLTRLISRDTRDTVQLDRLGKVGDAANHLMRLINDILDVSKIEAGKLTLEHSDFEVDDLLKRCMDMVAPRGREKGLALTREVDGLPRQLRGDPTRLSQMLINLLSNAVTFTEHGWVRLGGKVQAERPGQVLVRFEVQDTGPGIEPARQAALFQAFEQADNSISRRHGGSGLGLALTRQLAIAMDGEAGVDSAPGAGSTFWVTAWFERVADTERPATPPEMAPAAPSAETLLREHHAGRRVLLAEDTPINRDVAEELLRSAGLVVETAWDGARAVEMAMSRPYDLVLMDMQMPVLDGLEATRAIRERAGPSLPIVAMTANAFAEDRAACLDAGMNDHIAKPVDPGVMYATILRWLSSRQAGVAVGTAPSPSPVPVSDDSAALVARLSGIEGLDVEAALRSVGGRAPVLVRVLRRFTATYRAGLPALLDGSGDEHAGILRWRTACHSIRGALGTIGATALVEEVMALERELGELGWRAGFTAKGRHVHEGLLDLVERLSAALRA